MRASPANVPPPAVLVTGGAGFIGAAVTRRLLARGTRVLCLDDLSTGGGWRLSEFEGHPGFGFHHGDVTRPGVLARALLEEGPFEAVLHLAARVGVRVVLADPEGCRREHLAAVRELVRALAALPATERPRVFAASSSEVYLEKLGALREDDPVREVDALGRWAYAASKLAAERELEAARGLFARDRGTVHLRLFNVAGPGQDAGGGMVLARFVEAAVDGRPLSLHGSGRQVRTFAHVDEVARALEALLERTDVPAGPLNLGGTARTTVRALACAVARHAGLPPESILSVDPRRTLSADFEEVRWREPSLERARELGLPLPDRPLGAIVSDALAAARARAGRRSAACGSPAS